MNNNILYLLPSYNLYGGTPKKTLDLINHSNNRCFIYIWGNTYGDDFKDLFENSNAILFEGPNGRNILKHVSNLLNIIDKHNIQVIQSQFSFGEILAVLIKMMRPKVKIVIAFVGPFSPRGIKKFILKYIYIKVDFFVFISEFVKKEKMNAFPILIKKENQIIYNGTEERHDNSYKLDEMQGISLLDIAGLVDWKNAEVLIRTMIKLSNINSKIHLYIAGDGPMKSRLEAMIRSNGLEDNVFLLGYQSNIGSLLKQCDIFVHPAYEEGFGIAVAEAMIAEKPIIVANAGALPELIENEKTGLIVDPFNAEEWADAIIRLIEDKELASKLGFNAKKKATAEFSIEKFVSNYEQLYDHLLNK